MNRNGFTLIELVIVILILGILSAVAIPKFLHATNKARFSELPTAIATISQAQVIYNASENRYANCSFLGAHPSYNENLSAYLGLDLRSDYFKYTSLDMGNTFAVTAELFKKIGRVNSGASATVVDLRLFNYTSEDGDDEEYMKLYCRFLQ